MTNVTIIITDSNKTYNMYYASKINIADMDNLKSDVLNKIKIKADDILKEDIKIVDNRNIKYSITIKNIE